MSVRRKKVAAPPCDGATGLSAAVPSASNGSDLYQSATGFAITSNGAIGFSSDLEQKLASPAAAAPSSVPTVQNISRPNGSGSSLASKGSMVPSNREAWKRMEITCESMVEATPTVGSRRMSQSAAAPAPRRENRIPVDATMHEFHADGSDDEHHMETLQAMHGFAEHVAHCNIAAEMHGFFDHPEVDLGMRYDNVERCTRTVVRCKKPEDMSKSDWDMVTRWSALMQMDAYMGDVYTSYIMRQNDVKEKGINADEKATRKENIKEAMQKLKHSPFAAYHQLTEDKACKEVKATKFKDGMKNLINTLARSHEITKYPNKYSNSLRRKLKRMQNRETAGKPIDKMQAWLHERSITDKVVESMQRIKTELAEMYDEILNGLMALHARRADLIKDMPSVEGEFYISTPYAVIPNTRMKFEDAHKKILVAAQRIGKRFKQRRVLKDIHVESDQDYYESISVSDLDRQYTPSEIAKIRTILETFAGQYDKQPAIQKKNKKNNDGGQVSHQSGRTLVTLDGNKVVIEHNGKGGGEGGGNKGRRGGKGNTKHHHNYPAHHMDTNNGADDNASDSDESVRHDRMSRASSSASTKGRISNASNKGHIVPHGAVAPGGPKASSVYRRMQQKKWELS